MKQEEREKAVNDFLKKANLSCGFTPVRSLEDFRRIQEERKQASVRNKVMGEVYDSYAGRFPDWLLPWLYPAKIERAAQELMQRRTDVRSMTDEKFNEHMIVFEAICKGLTTIE